MEHNTCLNCGAEVTTKYCGNCGQKSSVHRFTFRHFIEHDIVHGMFHLDKGFPYTAKKLFTTPGRAIREYVEGKRISYFNPVTFLLFAIAINMFLLSASGFSMTETLTGNMDEEMQNVSDKLKAFTLEHGKQLIFLRIPIVAFCSWLIFRRAKQNYVEHMVLNAYMQSALLIIESVSVLLISVVSVPLVDKVILGVFGLGSVIYNFVFYYQYFRRDYEDTTVLSISAIGVIVMFGVITGVASYLFLVPYING